MNYRLTRDQIVDLIKRYKLESTTRANLVFPNEVVIRHIEQAQVKVVRSLEHEIFKRTLEVALEPGETLTLPDDLLQDLVAWWKNDGSTKWIPLSVTNSNALDETDGNWRDREGSPRGLVFAHNWDVLSETFVRTVMPIGASKGTLRLRYTAEPPPLSSGGVVPLVCQLMAGFDETLLPYGALSTLPLMEGGAEDERAQMFAGLFMQELAAYRGALQSIYNPGAAVGR